MQKKNLITLGTKSWGSTWYHLDFSRIQLRSRRYHLDPNFWYPTSKIKKKNKKNLGYQKFGVDLVHLRPWSDPTKVLLDPKLLVPKVFKIFFLNQI